MRWAVVVVQRCTERGEKVIERMREIEKVMERMREKEREREMKCLG